MRAVVAAGGGRGVGAGREGGALAQAAARRGAPSAFASVFARGLRAADPEVARLLAGEGVRRAERLSLVAAEPVVGRAAREACGAAGAALYAEGLPGARRAPGRETADALEDLARRRARELFGAEHANVQPHSGTQANLAAYRALLAPGDTVLSMDPAQGGHFSHGADGSAAAGVYRFVHYAVRRDTERVDLDEVLALARRERPALIVAGSPSHPRALDFAGFAAVARAVGARLMVDMAPVAGLVAAGLHPSPVPYADVVTACTHKTLAGPAGGLVLSRAELARAVDRAVSPGVQGAPLMAAVAAKAVAFLVARRPGFRSYLAAALADARALGRALQAEGLRLVAGGTDLHFVVADVRRFGLSGRLAEHLLEAAGLLVQRQAVPFDPYPPSRAAGIRAGTLEVAARGMGETEMTHLGRIIGAVLRAAAGEREAGFRLAREAAAEVRALAAGFPRPAG